MMMEALLTVPHDSARGMDMLRQIRDQLGESMEQMRTAVKQMNPAGGLQTTIPSIGSWRRQADRPGSRPSLYCRASPSALSQSTGGAIQNAREAITNAIRRRG